MSIKYITITNHKTGETIPISRSVTDTHPAWVHEQLGTSSEAELQLCLDQYNVSDWYDKDGKHLGPDTAGISMHAEPNIESICNIIRDRVGDRVTEEALHMSVSLESSVEEFVQAWEDEPLSDQQMAEEYLANNAEYQDDLLHEALLRDFLRGFGQSCGDKDPDGQWAAWSRQLTEPERKVVEAGGYESGFAEGLLFAKVFPPKQEAE